jgi:hypothetical protein
MCHIVHTVEELPALLIVQVAPLTTLNQQRLAVAQRNIGAVVLLPLLQGTAATSAAVTATAAVGGGGGAAGGGGVTASIQAACAAAAAAAAVGGGGCRRLNHAFEGYAV